MSNFINLSQKSRPYKIDVYGLQDNYLGTLQSYSGSIIGQVVEPVIELSTDGTQKFTCSIPKFYINPNTNQKELNPHWVDIDNGVLAENTRILKVFVDYGNEIKVYPFIVDLIVDKRDSHFSVFREIEASGLAFAELGKVGHKLELTQDTLLLELEENKDNTDSIIPTINYWLDKVFPNVKNDDGKVTKWLTPWSYEIKMDWSDYSEEGRESTKIYEDSYVSSWGVSEDSIQLVPEGFTIGQEKAAIIDCVNSNKYNITQAIAEAFNVFCQYEYKCAANGSFVREYIDQNTLWTGRKVVFYNKAVKKDKPLYIEYQKNLNSISRESDTSEIYTKMYVPKIESSIQSTGYISIADAAVNPLKDDFILNFDYLYSIGSISDYQKNAIKNYELQIRKYNDSLIDYEASIITMEEELNELETKLAFYKNEVIQAQEQHNEYQTLRDSIVGDELVERNSSNPYSVIFYEDGANKRATIRLSSKGIDLTKDFIGYSDAYSTQIFSNKNSTLIVTTEERQTSSEDKNFYLLVDSVGLPIGLYTNKNNLAGITYVYLKLTYDPKNVYEKVCTKLMETVISKQAYVNKYEQLVKTQQDELDAITKERDNILLSKEQENLRFESILGPALREGYWNPDTAYEDPGNEKVKNIKEQSSLLFDTELFEGEDKAYYYANAEDLSKDERAYYNYIDIRGMANSWQEKDLTQLVLHLKNPNLEGDVGEILAERYIYPNAGFIFGLFANKEKEIIPVIILNDTDIKYEYYNTIAYSFSTDITNTETETTLTVLSDADNYTLCYPRIELKENNINYNSTLQTLKNGDKELEEYKDYTILLRKGYPYYTLKVTENVNIYDILNPDFCLTYVISRANEKLYLDAKEVAFENSRPRYSYEVEVAMLPDAIENAELGQLVYINDYSLGLHNVSGYIDSITLQLDKQSEDKITIKNYKTKFEDLFETITATSEAMRNNQHSYDAAAGSFNPDGTISGDILQSSINSNNISLNFSNTNVAINDKDGILLTNTSAYSNGVYGQVALRGNGIFLSNSVDDNGERIWGTGITASGINASYLRAGQLDTNLIRIYSGDNIAFQWNPEGIFAYAHDENGVPIINKYVHYSDKGLQYVDNKHTAVDLGWNGLLISTQDGSTELTGDDGLTVYYGKKNDTNSNYAIRVGRFQENGNTTYGMHLKDIEGNDTLITKTDGTLWLKHSLTVGNEDGIAGISGEGVTSYDDEGNILNSPIRFWAGKTSEEAIFYVREDGILKATNADITGTITAEAGSFTGEIYAKIGKIGGWTIKEDGLENDDIKLLSTGEFRLGNNFNIDASGNVKLSGEITAESGKIGNWIIDGTGNLSSTDGKTIFNGSAEGNDSRININNVFSVSAEGQMNATNATISGTIIAGSGTIGKWNINEWGLVTEGNTVGLYGGNSIKATNDSPIRFWAGRNTTDTGTVYNLSITDNGDLFGRNIVAMGGHFSDVFYVGEAGEKAIIISGADNPYISSSQYSSGALGAGWKINYDGSAEFENVSVRGKISSVVFEHNRISSVGGSLYIAPTLYIEVESNEIKDNSLTWNVALFDGNGSAGGRTWKKGDKVKLDGSFIYEKKSFEKSDILCTIDEVDTTMLTLILPDNSLHGGKFKAGAAVVFYGTDERRTGLFLTSVGIGSPYLEIYDNDGKIDNPTPAVRLGNLSGIQDAYITSTNGLSGYGLYSSNAYLRGELRLPNAGVTNQSKLKRKGQNEYAEEDDDENGNNSGYNVRFWAGLNEGITSINEANFVVTQDGSLYANKGVFKGTVIADNSEFSGTIKTAGIIVDDPETSNQESSHSAFFVAYKDQPGKEDYILNIDSSGLSIWEGGLQAYSDRAASLKLVPYDYTQENESSILPYFYLVDESNESDNSQQLLSRMVSRGGHCIDYDEKTKTINSIILDKGIWLQSKTWQNNIDFESKEKEIFSSGKTTGILVDKNLLVLKNNDSIRIDAASLMVKNRIQIQSEAEGTLSFDRAVIKEIKNGTEVIGLDFIATI